MTGKIIDFNYVANFKMEVFLTYFAYQIALPLTAGTILGLFYFGGLWRTLKSLSTARRPAVFALTSFAIRTSLALGGFYLVMAGQPVRLMACLAGFFIARIILMQRISPAAATTGLRSNMRK